MKNMHFYNIVKSTDNILNQMKTSNEKYAFL